MCFSLFFQVYPILSESLQSEWDEAEQARYEELITEQVKDGWILMMLWWVPLFAE